MIYGYARASTTEKVGRAQTRALTAHGCTQIIEDKASSSAKKRPALDQLLRQLHAGDTLVVWQLDQVGHSLQDLINLVSQVQAKQANFISLKDQLDTTSAQGQAFAALARFERSSIRGRTKASLSAALQRDKQPGRPSRLSGEALKKAYAAKMLYLANELNCQQIGEMLGISRATVYRYLVHMGITKDSFTVPVITGVRHV